MRKKTVLAALAALTLGLAGCPRKDDDFTPQIRVAPGIAARALWMATYRPEARAAAAEKARAPSVRSARVHTMLAGEELGGERAAARPGDLMLENDYVVFVIERTGASLVDAADARTRVDELERAVATSLRVAYENVESGATQEGAAWILVEGHNERTLRVRTRYTLGAPDRAVMIETELKNEGNRPTEKLSLGDVVAWGVQPFVPGKSTGFSGPSKGPFVGAIGSATSYALASADGEIEGVTAGSVTCTFQRHDVTLAPGESVQYARIFMVGEQADSASLVAELAKMAEQR